MRDVRHVLVTTRVLEPPSPEVKYELPKTSPLLDVLREGARRACVPLLPTADMPLDRLHNISPQGEVGPPIGDLTVEVGEFVKKPHTTPQFGIQLVLAFRVNTRWAVAPAPELSPREILGLPAINLDYQQYSLYLQNSVDILPIDTRFRIERGMALEAQRDGKYGA